jgi:uncharacterized repeat protein (TIGR02543 family)
MVIDTFATGDLGTVITTMLSGDVSADITSLTVSGTAMDDTDFSSVRTLSSIVTIDISGVPITALPDYAFDGCAGLTSIDLPPGLTSIGNIAFSGCAGLTSIDLPPGLISIGDAAFDSCTSLALTSLPTGLITLGSSAFYNCESLALTSLPAGVISIDVYEFFGCKSLTQLDMSSCTVPTVIGYKAFEGCTSLAAIAIPPALTDIGSEAFKDCASLKSVAMSPASPPVISSYAFDGTASDLIFLVPDTSSYAMWTPPAGSKITMSDGSITPTGSTTVSTGESISFSCMEIAGASYQWERETSPGSWTPLSGAVSRTYSKSGASASDSGSYRAKITFGTVTPFLTASISLTVTTAPLPDFTVTFDSQGGSAVASLPNVTSGSTITAPAPPTKAGYSFGGWYKESACVNEWDFSTDTVTANITLYAKWTATFTVTFDSQGGSAVASLPNVTSGSTITAPAPPTKAGYSFGGWYKESAYENVWNFPTDTVTSGITLYAKWTPGSGDLAAESIEISGFPLTLAPGGSFAITVTYATADGSSPSPAPNIRVLFDAQSAALVSADVLSPYSVRITALPQEPRASASRAAPLGSIYGKALIGFEASQTLSDGSTVSKSAEKVLVVADDLPTSLAITDPVVESFEEANRQLISSEIVILPGNTQQPMKDLPSDWQFVNNLDNADIYVRKPDGSKLPDCYVPTGKDAADVTIDISRAVSSGRKGIVPMTYRVTVNFDDLASALGSSMASQILANPRDHLDDIFKYYVIQKEIHQGERTGWYTRLVDGILTPQRAIELGILEITGGSALDITLSYYVLDDTLLEAYESGSYLIVPDGSNDNSIVDPIWLNRWKDGFAPGDNSLEGGGNSGGGGCNGGAAALAVVFIAALIRKSNPRLRRLFTILLLISVSILSWAASCESAVFADNDEPKGHVETVEGSLSATRDMARVDLVAGSNIYEYDILETDPTGSAVIRFLDDSILEMGSGARIDIKELVFSSERNRFNVGLVHGVVRVITGAIVKFNPRGFKLTTPKSSIGIRGTTLFVEVTERYERVTVEELSDASYVTHTNTDSKESFSMTLVQDSVTVSSVEVTDPITGRVDIITETTTQGAGVIEGIRGPDGRTGRENNQLSNGGNKGDGGRSKTGSSGGAPGNGSNGSGSGGCGDSNSSPGK